MRDDEYLTISTISEGLYKEKGSRFIAIAIPVDSLDDIRRHLDLTRKKYHDARHHCYAYQLGKNPAEFRYNDGGEPSGTAGRPIYGQLQSFEATNLLIIVIRYFGGIKLGTGGLINAYRTAAKDALSNAKFITKVITSQVEIRFRYEQMNEVMRLIKDENLNIFKQDFGPECTIIVAVRKGEITRIGQKLMTLEKAEWRIIT